MLPPARPAPGKAKATPGFQKGGKPQQKAQQQKPQQKPLQKPQQTQTTKKVQQKPQQGQLKRPAAPAPRALSIISSILFYEFITIV